MPNNGREQYWYIVGLILVTKLLVFWQAAVKYEIHYNQWLTWTKACELLRHWDAQQYLDIATVGYQSTGQGEFRLAFFPLYPELIHVLLPLTHKALFNGFIISTIASVILGFLLLHLVRIDYDNKVALRAVWFLFIFPTAYFLHLPYTESVFLMLVVGAFLAGRKGWWLLAGILGGLAALTHDTGVLLILPLGVEALITQQFTKGLWLAFIVAGFGIFLFLNYRTTGDPLIFLKIARSHWGNQIVLPWNGYQPLGILAWMRPADGEMIGVQVFIFELMGGIAVIAGFWRLRLSYAVWMLLNWLVIVSQSWAINVPRLVLAMFPIFILEALAARNRLVHDTLTVWSLFFLALFSGEFALGHWAF